MLKKLLPLIGLILISGCQQPNGIQLVGCIDGKEWADFREYCLAPQGEWDPQYCRRVAIDLQCDFAPNAVVLVGVEE